MKKVIILILVLGSAFAAFQIVGRPRSPELSESTGSLDVEAVKRRSAVQGLTIKHFSWRKGGLGSVMLANFLFDNKSDFDLKDVTVQCTHMTSDSSPLEAATRTIYDTVRARSTKSVRDLNMGFIPGRARRWACEILDAEAGGYRAPPTKPITTTPRTTSGSN